MCFSVWLVTTSVFTLRTAYFRSRYESKEDFLFCFLFLANAAFVVYLATD
jgi:hypothetical protein